MGLVTGEADRLDLSGITLSSVGGLVYLIVIGSLVGFGCYSWLLRTAPTTLVVTYAYINPLVAVILGTLLAQEVLIPSAAHCHTINPFGHAIDPCKTIEE